MAKGPTWWKVYNNNMPLYNAMPRSDLGEAFWLAMKYMTTGELPPDDLSPLIRVCFETFKASIDEAISDYNTSVEYGRRGGQAKAAKAGRENTSTLP